MKINLKLALATLPITLTALVIIGSLSYYSAKGALTSQVLVQLESLADSRLHRATQIVDQNLERLKLVSSRTQLRASLQRFNEHPNVADRDKMTNILSDALNTISAFRSVSILAMDGEVVASTDGFSIGRNHAQSEFFVRGKSNNTADNFFLDDQRNLMVSLAGPLILGTEIIGVIVIHSTADNITALTSDYGGLGTTGETILAKKQDSGDFIYLTPLRFDATTALGKVPVSAIGEHSFSKVFAQAGLAMTDGIDYRGETVLAAARYSTKGGWGLLAKIDRAEAHAPVTRLRDRLIALVAILSMMSIGVSILVARSISRPIVRLTEAAGKFGQGDQQQRIATISNDEIGQLAQTFNDMANKIEADIQRIRSAHAESVTQALQQAAVAELGQHALLDIDIELLMDRAVGIIAGTLRTDYCKILELTPDGDFLLVAGEGWDETMGGRIFVSGDEDSQAGFTLRSREPVIVERLAEETRFSAPQLLRDHGVVSSMSVVIHGKDGPYGVLGVHNREYLKFKKGEADFMRAVANILGGAIEQKRAGAQIGKHAHALQQTADAVVITDRNGVIEYVNPAFEEMTGYSREEALGQQPNIVKSDKHNDEVYRQLWSTILGGEVFRDVLINRRKDGSTYYEEKTITPLTDAHGEITHFVATGKDITERMRTQERLHYLAHHDVLTELPNRMYFMQNLEHALTSANHSGLMVAVLFMDMDQFKVINDTLGHDIGDRLLKGVGQRLRGSIRASDTVARLGGDEFAIIIEHLSSVESVPATAEKILKSFEPPFDIDNRELFITNSIGISIYPDDGLDALTLLRNADSAMYRAKKIGRNVYQFYSADMRAETLERLNLETSLRYALERQEFRLYYQPQIDATSGLIRGMEALIRWEHPERGLISPVNFIPILEDSGLIIPVGNWVLETAIAQAKAWQDAGTPVTVAVNLSSKQFVRTNMAAKINNLLCKAGLDHHLLELEITESAIMENIEVTEDILKNLHAMGVRVAIDDFGTGYSSLSYLKRFPINVLKIDRSFIKDIDTDADDATIVSTIATMAHNLNLEIVAEGVETRQQIAFLQSCGCDFLQGFAFSKPLPAAEIDMTRRYLTGPTRLSGVSR